MDIDINGLKKSFGSLAAVNDINLHIQNGEFISLLGPSGCGKTTLLRMLAGLEQSDQGTIAFADKTVSSVEKGVHIPPQKREIGMVFQDFALWPHMTVYENVAFGLKAKGQKKNIQETVQQALDDVHLSEHLSRYPHQLSGGQQQRVAFARAIATNPKLILLDEPLSALDAALRDEMRLLLRRLVYKHGLTAIYVTHDQHEAMALSDRIAVLKEGRILQIDTPEVIYQRPATIDVASFVGKGSIVPVSLECNSGQVYITINGLYKIPWDNGPIEKDSVVPDLHAVIRPEQLTIRKAPKDDGIPCYVQTVSFLGERYEVYVKLEKSDQHLLAYTSKRFEIGELVYSVLDPADLYLLREKERSSFYETA